MHTNKLPGGPKATHCLARRLAGVFGMQEWCLRKESLEALAAQLHLFFAELPQT